MTWLVPPMQPVPKNELPEFGDYVLVEQFRYGVPNEHYVHKVIGRIRSNCYADVPVKSPATTTLHNEVVDVVSCICCGVDETTVLRYRLSDVRPTRSEDYSWAKATMNTATTSRYALELLSALRNSINYRPSLSRISKALGQVLILSSCTITLRQRTKNWRLPSRTRSSLTMRMLLPRLTAKSQKSNGSLLTFRRSALISSATSAHIGTSRFPKRPDLMREGGQIRHPFLPTHRAP